MSFMETGDEESLSPADRLTLLHVKVPQMRNLPPADLAFLIRTLRGSEHKLAIDAATILTHCDDTVLAQLIAAYPHTVQVVQRTILALLAGIDSEVAVRFLFELLQRSSDERQVHYITVCLAKSNYSIFTIVFFSLPTASLRYRVRLQGLLRMKGLEYATPFLIALPTIPDIEFFEDTYGIDEIRAIEQGKTR